MSKLDEFLFELVKTVNLGFDWAMDRKRGERLEFLDGDLSNGGRWEEYQGKKDAYRAVLMVLMKYRDDVSELMEALLDFHEKYDVSVMIDSRTGEPPEGSNWKSYMNMADKMLVKAEAALQTSKYGSVVVPKFRGVLRALIDDIEVAEEVGG